MKQIATESTAVALAWRRIPHATYRLQFNSAFTFTDEHVLLDYLSISDCYTSPIFQA
jgi:maltooligosyltrehalose synthase